MLKGLILITVCVMAVSFSATGLCQEQAAPQAAVPQEVAVPEQAVENTEYSEGTVLSVNADANEIAITEYDWNTDAEVNVTYSVDPAVQVENIASWKELASGNYIDIEYVVKDGKRIAKYINLYQQAPEAPASPEGAEAPEEAPMTEEMEQ